MTQDMDRDRLERLRGDLADLRARTGDQPDADSPRRDAGRVNAVSSPSDPPQVPPPKAATPAAPATSADEASRQAQRTAVPPRRLGRNRIPRPPRRSPFRRRARKPPQRLAVPTPIPVSRRSDYLAGPRFAVIDLTAGLLIFAVMAPVIGQMALRLWTAVNSTSVFLGADPSRGDSLQAAAGVAGGGITLALAVLALGIARGRSRYFGATFSILLLFVAFPYLTYTANAGIVAAATPSLGQMIAPTGWGRAGLLQTIFVLAAGALVVAVADLIARSLMALRNGILLSRER